MNAPDTHPTPFHLTPLRRLVGAGLLSGALALAGCSSDADAPSSEPTEGGEHAHHEGHGDHEHGHAEGEAHEHDHGEGHEHAAAAVAEMGPTEGNTVEGTVRFEPIGHDGVKVNIDLVGFEPGTTHAIHVHEVGDCSAPDGTSAGGHYNPGGHDHGLPGTEPRHAGDMGNITADANGEVHVERTFDNFSIDHHTAPVLGRGVIVHIAEDDGGQPTGNAGARLACGVIEAVE